MTFIKQPIPQQLAHMDTQYSEYQGAVFGSMGAFHYEADGKQLAVFDGGVLLGGTFYLLEGEETFTVKDGTSYLCVELDKADLGEPQFSLAAEWQTDSATHYIATVLLIKSVKGMITQVDQIGGNLPNVYNILSERVEDLQRNTLDTVARAMESRMRFMLGELDALAKNLGKNFDEKIKTVNTKIQTLDTRLKTNETKTGTVDSAVKTVDTKVKGLDTRLSSTDTRLQKIALYKHSIRVQFFVTGGLVNMIDARYVVNIAFNIYSKKTSRLVDNPINAKSSSFLNQIVNAMYDEKPTYGSTPNIVSATGDCMVWPGHESKIYPGQIWGIAARKPGQLIIFYSEERAHNQVATVGEPNEKGLRLTKVSLIEETITRVL